MGEVLQQLADLPGLHVLARVAPLMLDTQNRRGISFSQGQRRNKKYVDTVLEHYQALKQLGLNVDNVDQNRDLAPYRLVVVQVLYMLPPGFAENLDRLVDDGGALMCTYLTRRVDEASLRFLGGFPGQLRQALGLWIEDVDAQYDSERNGNRMEGGGEYACSMMCDLIHPEGAKMVGFSTTDFYVGEPCLTRNRRGAGEAWYLYFATQTDVAFLDAFYGSLVERLSIPSLIPGLPV